MSFVNNAINASRIYYEYLKANQGSLIKYDVKTVLVKGNYCFLRLKSKLRSLDMLQIKINTTIYCDERIKIIEYKEDANALKISADKNMLAYLATINPSEIQVVVDLKFLVKNVERFYSNFGYLIKLPTKTNNILYFQDEICGMTLSLEQTNAVDCALQHPLSYIWGAPGTGKTRFVLSQCILAYFQCCNDPKLLITAPTNNAVEQMLYGILPVLKDNNVDLNKILRLGTASYEFASRYPMCCEHKSLEKRIEYIKNQIAKIDNDIKQYQKSLLCYDYYEKCTWRETQLNDYLNKCEVFSELLNNIQSQYNQLLDRINSRNKQIDHLNGELITLNAKKEILIEKLKNLQSQSDALPNTIDSLTTLVQKYNSGIRKAFGKSKKASLLRELDEKIKAFEEIKSEIDLLSKQLHENEIIQSDKRNMISLLRNDIQNDNNQMRILENDFKKTKNRIILCITEETYRPNIYSISSQMNMTNYKQELNALFNYIEQELGKIKNEKDEMVKDDLLPKEEINDRISELIKRKEAFLRENAKLLSKSTPARIGECSIIAATIDNCIAKIIPNGDFMPMQIFLDEAGYCPFIKAAALFAFNAPVTLLGDHMQLPPICEMDPDSLTSEDKEVVLYCLSAVYIERINDSVDELFELFYNTKAEPYFNYTAFAELNHSFRFGESLANILANDVYSSHFKGSDKRPTNLFYIDSAKTDEPKARTSKAEVESIKHFLEKTSMDLCDLGIITPYKNQIKLLKKNLPNYEILTVHQSQGREWSTVILSVVDTTNKWFTNSMLKKSCGKNVINTAVSRAKENLIIVCDYKYWITQRKQLIGQILSVSVEIKPETLKNDT